MKKIMIFAVIFLSIILSSCEFLVKYDITVKNNCGFEIRINLDQSIFEPSPYNIIVKPNQTHVYRDLSYGTYHLHVRSTSIFTDGNYHFEKKFDVDRNETWTVGYGGGSYAVTITN